ncbi:MAG: hypothetical protein QOF28_674 [Actinomycetota bacterium]|jgi:hypothetical protein|nr:hypothetical protein [Actinomycetota bacterium]
MHRCAKAVSFLGLLVWLLVSALITLVSCIVFLLPFLLMLALDAIVGDQTEYDALSASPPAPPQRPFALSRWSRRAA